MECSTPGFPVHHQLPELAQSHVHQVGDAIQPSHPLSSPQPVPPIRKLPQACYPHPSEGRQNGNHNQRKLTKLDHLDHSLAHLNETTSHASCRATQDREIMVEGSDKTWSTREGNGKPLQYSCLENPMNRPTLRPSNSTSEYTAKRMESKV